MYNTEQIVKIKNPNLEADGLLLEKETVDLLKECHCTGKVTQVQDELVYVTFESLGGKLTQVFKEDEIEEVK